ncbi:Protein CBG27956 [Caenorhabditis briggsae]|uniref:Protein CBG27956 n=1 Tax=Caenorhabditis briggsae TaxID=6238 RepID=B6IJP8_CAEBR|nr:Protein CBG27956 [Caenorhabditis briggsae]CAS00128.1 Protein CBG27956 [Caenorhabditis briggsae]
MDDNRLVLCSYEEPRDWALKNGQKVYCDSALKITKEVLEEILKRHPSARKLRDEGNIVRIQDDDFVVVEANNTLAVESIKFSSKRPSVIFVVWPLNLSEWNADRTNKREPRVWVHPRKYVKKWETRKKKRVYKRKAKKEKYDEEPAQKVAKKSSVSTQKEANEAKMELEIKEVVSNSVQNQNGDQIKTNGNLERANPSHPAVPVALIPDVDDRDWSRNIYNAVLPPPANNVLPTAPITSTPKRPVGRPPKNKDRKSARNGANGLSQELNANNGNNTYAAQQAQAPGSPAVPNQALMHQEQMMQEEQNRRTLAERARYEQLQKQNGFDYGGRPATTQQQDYRVYPPFTSTASTSMGAQQGLGGYTYPGHSHYQQNVSTSNAAGYFGCSSSNTQAARSSDVPAAANITGPSNGIASRSSPNGAGAVPEAANYGAYAGGYPGMNVYPTGYPGANHEAYGGVYPGSPTHFSGRPGSNQATNGYPGSQTHLAAQPGSNQGANAYGGAPTHLVARPGSNQGAAAYPGYGAYPGAHPQAYTGARYLEPARYPEPYHGVGAYYGGYPAANPGAAAYPYPADPVVNPDANHGAANNAGAYDGRNI